MTDFSLRSTSFAIEFVSLRERSMTRASVGERTRHWGEWVSFRVVYSLNSLPADRLGPDRWSFDSEGLRKDPGRQASSGDGLSLLFGHLTAQQNLFH